MDVNNNLDNCFLPIWNQLLSLQGAEKAIQPIWQAIFFMRFLQCCSKPLDDKTIDPVSFLEMWLKNEKLNSSFRIMIKDIFQKLRMSEAKVESMPTYEMRAKRNLFLQQEYEKFIKYLESKPEDKIIFAKMRVEFCPDKQEMPEVHDSPVNAAAPGASQATGSIGDPYCQMRQNI